MLKKLFSYSRGHNIIIYHKQLSEQGKFGQENTAQMKLLTTFFALSIASTALFSQNIWRVDAASLAVFPTGTSWNLAFSNLQDALGIAEPGDEIWLAKGVYKPTQGADRHARFVLPSGVALLGGFDGAELTHDERDWVTHQSILSGDIGVPGDSTDNSYCLVYAAATDSNTVLDGLIIERANANNTLNNTNWYRPTLSGAGIYLDADGGLFGTSYLSVFNCIVRNNSAFYQAGGIYANGRGNGAAILQLKNTVVQQNRAGFYGAGVAIENYTNQSRDLDISGCSFLGNYGTSTGGSALLVSHKKAIKFSDCQFKRNKSFSYGSIYFLYGGNHEAPVVFEDCVFEENSASIGAAMQFILNDATTAISVSVSRCRFFGQLGGTIGLQASGESHQFYMDNCVFYNNVGQGNALFFESGTIGAGIFTNCLLYKNWNSALYGPSSMTSFFLTNTIVIDEAADQSLPLGSASVYLNYCMSNVANCAMLGSGTHCNASSLFSQNPQFVLPSPEPSANFQLQPCSAAINAGYDLILDTLSISTDITGNQRIRHGRVDLGPYETNLSLLPVILSEPSCAGKSDASLMLSGNICAPYTLIWDNGSSTGSNLSGLAAGTYLFMVTDAKGRIFTETVVIQAPDSLVLEAIAGNNLCYGTQNGFVNLITSGGTPFPSLPHYEYYLTNPPTTGLPAGNYTYQVSDANGCSASATVSIAAPPPFEFFYSVQDATSPNACDGAITFDSIAGGWNGALTPADLTALCPGSYVVTVVDSYGCSALVTIIVSFVSAVEDPGAAFAARVFPNPCYAGAPVFIETGGNEAFKARIFDLGGRMLREFIFKTGNATLDLNGLAAGAYLLELLGESGWRDKQRLLVLGRE